MKAVQNYLQYFTLLMALIIAGNQTQAQEASKETNDSNIKGMIDSKEFVFIATSVTPSRGGFRQLNSVYDLRVSDDSLVSNLPYFGRAYSAPINPSTGGFNFTSTSFDYTVKARKKGGWDVLIKPKDHKDVQQFSFNIFENGSASLQVISNNRQPISFNGNVTGK